MPQARRIAVRKSIINMAGYKFSQFEVDADSVIEVTNEDRVKLKKKFKPYTWRHSRYERRIKRSW